MAHKTGPTVKICLLLAVASLPFTSNGHATLTDWQRAYLQGVASQYTPSSRLDEVLRQTPGYPCLGSTGFIADISEDFQCLLRTLEVIVLTQAAYDRPADFKPILERGLRRFQDTLLDPWLLSEQSTQSLLALIQSRATQRLVGALRLPSMGFTVRHGFGIFRRSPSTGYSQDAAFTYQNHSVETLTQAISLANAVIFAGGPTSERLPLPAGQYDLSELLHPGILSDLNRALFQKSSLEVGTGVRYWSDSSGNPNVDSTALALKALLTHGESTYWSKQEALPTVRWILHLQKVNGSWLVCTTECPIAENIVATGRIAKALLRFQTQHGILATADSALVSQSIKKAMAFIFKMIGHNSEFQGPLWDVFRSSGPINRMELANLQIFLRTYAEWSEKQDPAHLTSCATELVAESDKK